MMSLKQMVLFKTLSNQKQVATHSKELDLRVNRGHILYGYHHIAV